MAKTKKKTSVKRRSGAAELDTVYTLKLVMYLILGSQWVRFQNGSGTAEFALPVGLIVGLVFVAHDHFRIDRKIELAVLLVAMFVGFWTHVGVYFTY